MYQCKYFKGAIKPSALFKQEAGSEGLYEVLNTSKEFITRSMQQISNRALRTNTKIKQTRYSMVDEAYNVSVIIKIRVIETATKPDDD